MAIKTDGSLWTWGRGTDGVLGNSSILNRSSPVQTVAGGTNWRQVAAHNSISSAVKIDGTLWVWGSGTLGRLGNNSTINHSSPIQTVSATTDWKQVDSGGYHSAAVKTDGTLWLSTGIITTSLTFLNGITISIFH